MATAANRMNAPSNNPFASASLYVGDLASDVTEATLFELFNAVGPVASIRVCRDATTRRSLGYAYVNFHSVQDAERALDTMNFTNIRGKQCRIMWSQRDPRLRQSGKGNIFVKNLHESIDNKTLYDTFSVFGNILSCKVVIDKETQKSRGYGYVHYVDDKSAKKAIEGVNGMTISDRKVHAELFKPREERIKNYKYTNVYVKYIPSTWTDDIIKGLFEKQTAGRITKWEIWRKEYGVSACLNFADADSAKAAVEKLNGKSVNSFKIDEISPNDIMANEEEKKSGDDTDDHDDEDEKDDEKKNIDETTTTDDTPKGKDENQQLMISKDEEQQASSKKSQVTPPTKLYVARAQKRKERKEFLQRQQKKRGIGRARNYTGANLYVKNLSPDVDDSKLKEMFVNFGSITSAKVMREQSGKSRGFGFVAFEKKEAATRAIHEMTNTLHHGKPLYVSRAQTKAFRQTFIMKQLRQRKMRNNMGGNSGGGGGGGGSGGFGGGPGPNQGGRNNMGGNYGGPGPNQGGGGGGYGGGGGGPVPNQYGGGGGHIGQNQGYQSGGFGGRQNQGYQGGGGGPMGGQNNPNIGGIQNQQQSGAFGGGGGGGIGRGGPQQGPPGPMGVSGMGGAGAMGGPSMGVGPMGAPMAGPMGPYGNPQLLQQLQAQQIQAQTIAAQQRAAQIAAQQGAATNPQLQAQIAAQQLTAQQISSMQQAAVMQSSHNMASSIQQQAAHRSQSMVQTGQQSQPAQSMQSGPQSTSMYAGSASIPRPSGVSSQGHMVTGVTGAIASQPHQSSVPTGQHSVSQLSAGGAGQASAPMLEVNPLTAEMLQDAKPAEKKRLIGERLFPKIQVVEPRLAGKITGMLLEMDNTELLVLLSEQRALMNKINEALAVLKDHQQKQSQQNPGSTKNPSSQNPGLGSAAN